MSTRVPIQETFEIPSRGKIYTDMEVPAEFTLRAMTTVEEKLRLSGQGTDVMPRLIQACTVSPTNVDVSKLSLFDLQFLMYKLRIVTYGSAYNMEVRCPFCGATKKITVNLDDIPVKYVDEVPSMEFDPLPISGDKIECRFLTSADFDYIFKEARRIKSKFPDYVGDPEFMLTLQRKIYKINGEEVLGAALQKYVEEMHMRDVAVLNSNYNKASEYGMDTVMTEKCNDCGEEFEFRIATDNEFFRPEY